MSKSPLIESLQQLKADRAAMAALRKALIPQQRERCYRYLPRLGCSFDSESDLIRYLTIAHTWGHHPLHTPDAGNMGSSLRRLTGGNDNHPINRRFARLISCDSLSEFSEQIRSVLPLIKREGVPIDFDLLNNALFWFSKHPDQVRLAWSAGFYVERSKKEAA